MPNVHEFLPYSGAAAWVECAYWPTANRDNPEPATPASMEGEAGHWVAEQAVRGNWVEVGTFAPNGFPIDAEMLAGARLFVDTVTAHAPGVPMYLEQKFKCPSVHPEDNGGTPDAIGHDARVIYDFEYKYGHGFIPAVGNWQIANQVFGFADFLEIDGPEDENWQVKAFIIQPRNYERDGPVRMWECQLSDLRPQFGRLHHAAHRATFPNPPATVGSQCDFCPGRSKCSTLQASAYRVAQLSRAETPFDLSSENIGAEYRALMSARELLDARVSGLENEIMARVENGDVKTGFALDRTRGRTVWTAEPERIIALGEAFGVSLAKKTVAATPRQAVEQGLPKEMVARFSTAQMGNKKLVPIEQSAVHKAFTSE